LILAGYFTHGVEYQVVVSFASSSMTCGTFRTSNLDANLIALLESQCGIDLEIQFMRGRSPAGQGFQHDNHFRPARISDHHTFERSRVEDPRHL
jgi:hypothetical protein